MKLATTAIVIVLMSVSTVLAQTDERGASPRASAIVDVGGPLHRSAAHEAERLASMRNAESSQSGQGRRVRHPVLLGAAIGAGAGFLLNATACRTGESVCTSAGNLMMAGIGAAIGATIGALVSR